MENLSKLESIVELYFSKKYKLYKPQDANGEDLGKWFEFESRAHFLDAYLNYYRNLPNLKSAIVNGCSAKFKILYESQEYELKHNHQEEFKDEKGNLRGVNNSVLSSMAVKLTFKTTQLEAAESFDDVYRIVKSAKVSGFGELSIYDAAIRISAFLGFKPTKVFLHAGTRIGAEYLENKGLLPEDSSLEDTLELSEFPEPIQKLDAMQLENFLCSFKNDLKKI
ncbi:hypothetical protein BCV35_007740 [Vibrio cyclitrophicus]|uniref:hypothetical protein n=1 Tax=Vibrio cyclitrophicus TaxID=47951 RepID=UPI000C847599|nr:hypothetical protein [Vibrio cyclitrophicus]PME53020.1 hypothetical protein BCV35_21360 [Vibrio cyclitrophicus]PMF61574.1 hypothetical protein BCV12_20200 [Vibrio cyclitrophicus]PMH51531.1 hypothetical protein BCU67_10590 [Vibrio cyclitrophicus]PMO10347.1 hypothetical protein BCT18_02660 [Vibrio cyclitrophicus]